eukprot:gene30678-35699_t
MDLMLDAKEKECTPSMNEGSGKLNNGSSSVGAESGTVNLDKSSDGVSEAAAADDGGPGGDSVMNEDTGCRSVQRWAASELKLLSELVAQHGTCRKWTLIASKVPGRSGKQCRERWLNHARPEIFKHGDWSSTEEYCLMKMHVSFGTCWSRMAKLLPGRSDNAVKNHFNATQRCKAVKKSRSILWLYISILKSGKSGQEAVNMAVREWTQHVPLSALSELGPDALREAGLSISQVLPTPPVAPGNMARDVLKDFVKQADRMQGVVHPLDARSILQAPRERVHTPPIYQASAGEIGVRPTDSSQASFLSGTLLNSILQKQMAGCSESNLMTTASTASDLSALIASSRERMWPQSQQSQALGVYPSARGQVDRAPPMYNMAFGGQLQGLGTGPGATPQPEQVIQISRPGQPDMTAYLGKSSAGGQNGMPSYQMMNNFDFLPQNLSGLAEAKANPVAREAIHMHNAAPHYTVLSSAPGIQHQPQGAGQFNHSRNSGFTALPLPGGQRMMDAAQPSILSQLMNGSLASHPNEARSEVDVTQLLLKAKQLFGANFGYAS